MRHGLLIDGVWREAHDGVFEEVRSPYDGRVVGEAATAGVDDVDAAIAAATRAAHAWARTPAHERNAILLRAAQLADERTEAIAHIISSENGKSLLEARGEAGRTGEIIRLSAYEGSQLYGTTLPLDANKGTGREKLGFTLREPCGVVVAITPFNYPALLVMHKIGPALAAGNAVVLKPARATPLTAIAIAQCFMDAGLPAGVLNVITGAGGALGDALVGDPRVRKVSFTGSTATGTHIASIAGVKKLSLELGSSCPVVVLPDCDVEYTANAVALGGYINAGQVCISVQRVIVHRDIEREFLDALTPLVQAIRIGDPLAAETRVGTLINEREAVRVEASIRSAVAEGARLVTGGARRGCLVEPAIVAGVEPDAAFAQDELFGPAISVTTASDWDEALRFANASAYGLGAGVFTRDIDKAIRAAREVEAGVVHINWTPLWRADLMPYGGLKASGVGKEGVRSAIEEMTEVKTVILHGRPWEKAGQS